VRGASGVAIGLLAALWIGQAAYAGSAISGLHASREMGLQLSQPAASETAGATLDATIVAPGRFNAHGFSGARRGDQVRITVLVPGKEWRVQHVSSGAQHTFEDGPRGLVLQH
jgi:hypothetical protein